MPMHYDFSDVRGNVKAVRALERAAADHANVLIIGPPGAGKTMLACRLPSILPPPSAEERKEIAMIYLGAGLEPPAGRPFRAPHHTISDAGMFGLLQRRPRYDARGRPIARKTDEVVVPGEFSLAHGGVLFLDELPEFRRETLERIAAVVRLGYVVLGSPTLDYVYVPSRPLMIGATNPCPCGWYGSEKCQCLPSMRESYTRRINTLRSVFSLTIHVEPVQWGSYEPANEPSALIAARVTAGRNA